MYERKTITISFMHNFRERYGDWALVTGASSGIGYVFAQRLAASGMNLVIAARRIDLLNDVSQQLTRDQGVDVMVLAPGATETPGKYLHPVDYSKLPITWMSADEVVDTALKCIGKKIFVIPGVRNHLTACLSGGLWSRGLVQGVMKRLARIALPLTG